MFIQKLIPLVLASLLSILSLSYCTYNITPSAQAPGDSTAQSSGGSVAAAVNGAAAGSLEITFDYAKQSGSASNQFAVWIEDANHEYVTTLYATRFTANGGYKNRPDSLREWVAKSDLASMDKTEVDAISGATPAAGPLIYAWDLTDANGAPVPDGMYIFIVEGTLRWKNNVQYTGAFEVGGAAADIAPEPQYTYEGAGNQPALNSGSTENNMLSNLSAHYNPS